QAFDNDRLDITVGRTNPTLDFATNDIACEFISSIICAQPGSWYFTNDNQAYPASTWGSRINFVPAPNYYIRTGAFEDDPSQYAANQNGFNWNVEGATGVFIPLEVGYATSFSNSRYPVKYDIGGYYDDATYTQPNTLGLSRGRSAFYIQGLQTIWRPNPNTKQSLQVFGGAIVYGPGAAYWGQYYAGLFDRAPFASRPDDTIGLIASYYAMSSTYNPNKSSQWIMEANYGFKVYSGVTFKPYVQYIVNPNNVGLGIPTVKQPSNATVVGFQVNIDVGALFKFPTFVAY
ncbi:MAG TPA: carbohydrate porin, partial [Rhodopila sp.]|nr:carbohydrate porin [Rhodopila sp.]